MPTIDFSFDQKPEEAIKAFVQKGNAPSWNWYEVWQEAHAKYFTVAKVMKLNVLRDIRNMVQKSLDEGITFHQFKKELEPKLRNAGWWGKDKDTGAQLGSPYRLKVIFQNNLNAAYSAGRYKQMMDNVQYRPWWQYWTVGDTRVRYSHKLLHGKVFHYTDPFWDYFFAPNEWGCRCKIRALSKKDLDRSDITPEKSGNRLKTEDRPVSLKSDIRKPVGVYRDPKTGLKVETAPGWSYNPGKAAWSPDLEEYPNDLRQIFTDDGTYQINPKFRKEIEKSIKDITSGLEKWNGLKSNAKKYIYDLPEDKFYWIRYGAEIPRNKVSGFWHEKEQNLYIRNDIAMDLIFGNEKDKFKAKHTITHETVHGANKTGYTAYIDEEKQKKNPEKEKERAHIIDNSVTELITKNYLAEEENAAIYNKAFLNIYRKPCTELLLQLIEKHSGKKNLKNLIEEELLNSHTGKDYWNRAKWAKDFDEITPENYQKLLPLLLKNGIISKEAYDLEPNKIKYIQEEVLKWYLRKKKKN